MISVGLNMSWLKGLGDVKSKGAGKFASGYFNIVDLNISFRIWYVEGVVENCGT